MPSQQTVDCQSLIETYRVASFVNHLLRYVDDALPQLEVNFEPSSSSRFFAG